MKATQRKCRPVRRSPVIEVRVLRVQPGDVVFLSSPAFAPPVSGIGLVRHLRSLKWPAGVQIVASLEPIRAEILRDST
jgi:hypothetical protein